MLKIVLTVLEISSIEILWVINIKKNYPSGWGGQTLANTYNKLSISFNNWGHTNAQEREILLKDKTDNFLIGTPPTIYAGILKWEVIVYL